MAARVRDPDRRRRELVDAAHDEFVERGFAGARTADVAAAAGVAEGTVFHHFGSKLGLLEAVAERDATAFVQRVVLDPAVDTRTMVAAAFATTAADALVGRIWTEGDDAAIGAVRRGWAGSLTAGMERRLAADRADGDPTGTVLLARLAVALVAEALAHGLEGDADVAATIDATAGALERLLAPVDVPARGTRE